jgi:hypothetical protein
LPARGHITRCHHSRCPSRRTSRPACRAGTTAGETVPLPVLGRRC